MKDIISIWNRLVRGSYSAVRVSSTHRKSRKFTATPEDTTTCCGVRGINRGVLTSACLGVIGLLIGIAFVVLDPYTIIFNWKCTFGPGGEIFELWKTPPVDLYLRVYLWNVTNKDDFLSGKDDKLRVQDVGPYVYKELMRHEDVIFNDNGTLTATPKHPLVWVPELSEGRREDDLLILPNIALLSITHVVAPQMLTRFGLNMLIRQLDEQPLVQMTAKEFMFGYSSDLMTMGNSFLGDWIYFDKLGLIDRMYEFGGDFETIYTGETDISKAGLIDTYRGSTKIPQWNSPCGDVQYASDGTKFPGNIKPNDTLLFFRKSMCRAKALKRVGSVRSSGFDCYIYHFDDNQDDNGKINEKNQCFCDPTYPHTIDSDQCLPPGLLDVHGCYYGFPIALSYPHYLDGSPLLSAKIVGNKPDPEKHRSYFIIQPDTGLPTELAVRYQINMALGDLSEMANVERFANMVVPLLWTETRLYKLPDKLKSRFQLYINIFPLVMNVLTYALVLGGIAFLILSIYKFRKSRSQKSVFNAPWIEDELVLNIDRKISSYLPERKADISSDDLDIYLSTLITSSTMDLDESQMCELKEVVA